MMKKILFFSLLLYGLPLHSQVITVNDFINLTSLADKKLSSYVGKMGFAQIARNFENGVWINEFAFRDKKQPADSTVRFLSGFKKGKASGVIYQTSSFGEYQVLLREFMLNGFIGDRKDSAAKTAAVVKVDTSGTDSAMLLQKEDITILVKEEIREEVRVFKFALEKKPVPTKSAVRFADDLLLFNSHENLVAMFGESNVRHDMYFFSQMDSSRCTVIFPNTTRQAIFIWDDQLTDRGLAFLMIGGGLRAEGSANFNQSVALNMWHCNSGLYTGMRLAEIVRMNESDFEFYGAGSEFAFMAVPVKKGNMDFKKIGITLGCLNCSGSPLIKKEKINTEAALDAGLQLYVSSIVLMP